MTDTIHRLPSAVIPGDVNQDVVDRLEELLKRARSGELRAIAYTTVLANTGDPLGFATGTGWIMAEGTKWALSAAVMTLHHRVGEMLAE